MIDHMGFRVRDLAAARKFYDACTQAVGLQTIDNSPESFLHRPQPRGAHTVYLGRHGAAGVLG